MKGKCIAKVHCIHHTCYLIILASGVSMYHATYWHCQANLLFYIQFSNQTHINYIQSGGLKDDVWWRCEIYLWFSSALNVRSNATLQRFDCSIYNTAVLFQRYRKSLSPILPGYPFLLTPWRGPLHSWNQYTLEMLEDEAKVENVTSEEFFEQTCTPVMVSNYIHLLELVSGP